MAAPAIGSIDRICAGRDAYDISISSTHHRGKRVVFVEADRAHYTRLVIPIPNRVPDEVCTQVFASFPNDEYIIHFEYDSIQPRRVA